MTLKTERLALKEVHQNDLQQVHALHLLPETDRHNTLGIPESIDETQAVLHGWIISTDHVFTISGKEDEQFIGIAGIKPGRAKYRVAEIWYKLHPQAWNKGYATEAVKELLRFGFEDLLLHRIEAGCSVENIASARVMEKAGMLREGMKRKVLPIRGEWIDGYIYAILEEDWNK